MFDNYKLRNLLYLLLRGLEIIVELRQISNHNLQRGKRGEGYD